MTNCKHIIEGAYARRAANDPDRLATKGELIKLIERTINAVYARVAKVSLRYFGTQSDVTGVASVWARPTDAVGVLWVENASNERVYIVPFGDRDSETVGPRIYPYGRNFHSVGEAGDPTAVEVLTFYYSKRHPALDSTAEPDAVANELDDSWPEQYNDILISKVARYLALKAGRAEETQHLEVEFTELLAMLEAEASDSNDRVSQRYVTE